MTRLCIGIDPGQSASVSLLLSRPGRLPVYLCGWSVWGTAATWEDRLIDMRTELRVALRGHPRLSTKAYLEVPGGQGRSRRGSRGPASFWRMMQAGGRIQQVMRDLSLPVVEVESGAWPKALSIGGRCLPVGKQGDGRHRLSEAGLLVEGAQAALASLPLSNKAERERAVCRAESALIAAAGALVAA